MRKNYDNEADPKQNQHRKIQSRFVIGEGDARITGRRAPDDTEMKEADRLLSKVLGKRELR